LSRRRQSCQPDLVTTVRNNGRTKVRDGIRVAGLRRRRTPGLEVPAITKFYYHDTAAPLMSTECYRLLPFQDSYRQGCLQKPIACLSLHRAALKGRSCTLANVNCVDAKAGV
jgi:hypothetical protein